MKTLIFLSFGFLAFGWAKPDFSHLTNINNNINEYLPPLQSNSNPCNTCETAAQHATAHQFLQHIQGAAPTPRARIESIQPSINLASFSVQTTVPLAQTQQHSREISAIVDSGASLSTSSGSTFNYNAQQSYEPTLPAVPEQQNYDESISIHAPAESTYIQLSGPQENYIQPDDNASSQTSEVSPQEYTLSEQNYAESSRPQPDYIPPAPEQNYAAPINAPVRPQQEYIPPLAAQQIESQRDANQYYLAPAQPTAVPVSVHQQSILPADFVQVHQTYAPSEQASSQQNFASSQQQTYSSEARVQSDNHQAPSVAQSSYTSSQQYLSPRPAQQYNAPLPETYASPLQEAVSTPPRQEQAPQISTPQLSAPLEPQQNYNSPLSLLSPNQYNSGPIRTPIQQTYAPPVQHNNEYSAPRFSASESHRHNNPTQTNTNSQNPISNTQYQESATNYQPPAANQEAYTPLSTSPRSRESQHTRLTPYNSPALYPNNYPAYTPPATIASHSEDQHTRLTPYNSPALYPNNYQASTQNQPNYSTAQAGPSGYNFNARAPAPVVAPTQTQQIRNPSAPAFFTQPQTAVINSYNQQPQRGNVASIQGNSATPQHSFKIFPSTSFEYSSSQATPNFSNQQRSTTTLNSVPQSGPAPFNFGDNEGTKYAPNGGYIYRRT